MAGTQRAGLRALPLALPHGQLAQLVGQRRNDRRGGYGWLVGASRQAWAARARGLLFAHRFQRRVGLDGCGVDGLRVAGDQAPGHALGEDVVEQAFEDRGGEELPGVAHGRVPGQLFVDLVAKKQQDVQPQGAVFDQTMVADQVFQPAHRHEFEEHHRVEQGLARVAV